MEAIDVVIATRGTRPAMLAEAVQSVRDQKYPGIVRIYVVYDCDVVPADSPGVDDPLLSVHSLTSGRPRGLAGARNAGVAASGADWIAFLDDDDLWLPGKLDAQIRLATSSAAAVVTTGIEIAHQDGTVSPRPSPRDVVSHADLIRDRLAELHPSSFLIRRTALESVGGVDEALPGGYAEDYDLLLRLSTLQDVVCVRAAMTRVRWTGDSYFFSRWQTIALALRYLLQKHPAFEADRVGWARIQGQIAFAEAAMGHRRVALQTAAACSRRNPRELRAVLAAVVATGLISADTVQRGLHRTGRGI